MGYYGKAVLAAQDILKAFEKPNLLPSPLAQVFILRGDRVPCRSWSWRNQLLIALHGFTDARSYLQWQAVGRHVRQNERAFFIFCPVKRRFHDPSGGEVRLVCLGFKGTPVFGFEQTEGLPLPASDPGIEKWIEELPLVEVAKSWGLSVRTFDGEGVPYLGRYRPGRGIEVGLRNLATYAHELVHAADDRNGSLIELGQHWRPETVAELGGAVLLRLLGHDHEADLGGCWAYVRWYAGKANLGVVEVCGLVLERVCSAVALLLDTAEQIKREASPAAP